MSTLEFYRTQAAQASADAEDATLDNVRDRCERSAKAWQQMVERAERTEVARASRVPAPKV